jgi:hypothetical protein
LAVDRVVADGPATAVTLAASRIDLNRATRTTAKACLSILEAGGDVVDSQTADASAHWLLEHIADPTAFISRTTPTYHLPVSFTVALEALIRSCTPGVRLQAVQALVQMPPQMDELSARSWIRIIQKIPRPEWTEDLAMRIGQASSSFEGDLSIEMTGVASIFDAERRTALIGQARDGSHTALRALGDPRGLDSVDARVIIAGLVQLVAETISQAKAGVHGLGGRDFSCALALFNFRHPIDAVWDPVIELISDPAVAGHQKRETFELLTMFADSIPNELRNAIIQAAQRELVKPKEAFGPLLTGVLGANGPAAELLQTLSHSSELDSERLLNLLRGNPEQRRWAARVALRRNDSEAIGVLTALVLDDHPVVRASAASGLARICDLEAGGPLAESALRLSLEDPGTYVPLAIASTLSHPHPSSELGRELLAKLITHPSAHVRSLASGGLS